MRRGGMFASPTHTRTYAGPLWVRRRHTRHVNCASALPLKADIHRGRLDVSYGPIGDIEETILAPPAASADAAHAPSSARRTEATICVPRRRDQPTAIHREVDAGDRGSVLARQEADGACNFFWAYHSSQCGIIGEHRDVTLAFVDRGLQGGSER